MKSEGKLTRTEATILYLVREREQGCTWFDWLVSELKMDKAQVSRTLTALEKKNLLRKEEVLFRGRWRLAVRALWFPGLLSSEAEEE